MRKLKDLSDSEKSEIINQRKIGITEKEISKKFDISLRQYYNLLKLNNIEQKSKVVKYNFNESYFENIDTEDKAYFLGFIVADGSVNSISNVIQITQKEPDILYEFKRYIKYEGDLIKSKTRDVFDIKISSSKMKSDLLKLGISPNKTMSVNYPLIPENLQNHFMRGVFDGDGCISIHHDKRDNSDRGQVNICSGSFDFIEKYVDNMVKYCGVKKNNIRQPKGTYYVIDWGGLSDVESVYEFLYKESNIFLKRKKETYDKVMSINKTKNKYRKKCQS
jgi:hypothetical protein